MQNNMHLKGATGKLGEDVAATFLVQSGFTILQRNARYGGHEVDIIAREGDTIAFIEVKTRHAGSLAEPEDNLSPRQIGHLRKAAHAYASDNADPDTYYRFDLVSVCLLAADPPKVVLYRDAFSA